MVAAVKALPQEVLDKIDYREWSLRTGEGVARFRELRAKSLPAVAVEEKLLFECIIPPAEDLIAAIEAAGKLRQNSDTCESAFGAPRLHYSGQGMHKDRRRVGPKVAESCAGD